MKEQNEGNQILVHCYAGVQRSAAILAMYLIAKRRMTAEEVMLYIQGIRPIAFRPMANFKESIINFYNSYQQEILPKLLHLE
jgi:protein-tyrosine phosphatase